MTREVAFFVRGEPEPQGSSRAVPLGGKRGGRPVIISDNPNMKRWRETIGAEARRALGEEPLIEHPVRVDLIFRFVKPQSASRRVWAKTTRPDVDKLVRAAFDALTLVVWRDDAQVIDLYAKKEFSDHAGVYVRVRVAEPEDLLRDARDLLVARMAAAEVPA